MDKYHKILKKYWGYSSFRDLQLNIIKKADDGEDVLGLMPTGGGKSIVFQVVSLVNDGICLVVTPLIALMKDQVENLKKKGIRATAIYSGMSKEDINIQLDNCIFGNYKFLYLSPERLKTELFLIKLDKLKINLLAIDEAHCISQWGYDFRPSYLQVAEIRTKIPQVPILALTATATPEVAKDIQEKLLFKKDNLLQKSFERKNISYVVRKVENKYGYILKILSKVEGSGLIYVRSKKKTKEISDFLQKNKISADYYHAGLEIEEKDRKQKDWKRDKIRIIVATNAFGMGIDKSDVRLVIHMDIPDSIEAYFQEAGRAGRDEKKAFGILLYNNTDIGNIKRRAKNTFPSIDYIKKTYNALGNFLQIGVGSGAEHSFDFDIFKFSKNFKLQVIPAYNSLKILQTCGYIVLSENINIPTKVYFSVNRDDLYKIDINNKEAEQLIQIILRSYTGVFTEYIGIDDYSIAKKINISKQKIYKLLIYLSKYHILKFIPRKNTPIITYVEHREETQYVSISKGAYHDNKKRYLNRISQILKYTEKDQVCRSIFLLQYFGEKNVNSCGECDICRKNTDNKINNEEFQQIRTTIEKFLQNEKLKLETLIDKLNFAEYKVIKTLNWMLDNKMITQDKDKRVYLSATD